MADEMESVLRNALDAVDRGRRWAMIGAAALFIAIALGLFALFHTAAGAPGGEAASLKTMYVTAVAGMLFILCCTAALMLHVTRMTKSVLRAIDGLKR